MRTSSQKRLWKWAATILISPEGCIPAMFPICLYSTVCMYRHLMFVELSWKGKHISNEGNILSCVSYAYPFSYLAPIYPFVTLARNKKLHLYTVLWSRLPWLRIWKAIWHNFGCPVWDFLYIFMTLLEEPLEDIAGGDPKIDPSLKLLGFFLTCLLCDLICSKALRQPIKRWLLVFQIPGITETQIFTT